MHKNGIFFQLYISRLTYYHDGILCDVYPVTKRSYLCLYIFILVPIHIYNIYNTWELPQLTVYIQEHNN